MSLQYCTRMLVKKKILLTKEPIFKLTRTIVLGSPTCMLKKLDEDEFGNLELEPEAKLNFRKFDFLPPDADDADSHDAIIGDVLRPNSEQCLRQLNHLVHVKRDLPAALKLLNSDMKEMAIKPRADHFTLLFQACGKVGYVTQAFQLLRDLRARGLPLKAGMITSLYLSCSLSPSSLREYSLSKAHYLTKKLAEDHVRLNQTNYHAAIQAFGRLRDLETAFSLVDQMREEGVQLTTETFSLLLQGCVSDKEHGFRHALLTWRKLRRKRLVPSVYLYNLTLRAALECGLGEQAETRDILIAALPQNSPLLTSKNYGRKELEWWEKEVTKEEGELSIPNLLARRPKVENIVSLQPLDTKETRLALIGGSAGFLAQMGLDRVGPDIKTFSLLLRLQESGREQEEALMAALHQHKVKPDTAFFNQLIKGRVWRGEHELARSTLSDMFAAGCSPDLITYGVLAAACQSWKEVNTFIDSLKDVNTSLNVEILTQLVKNMSFALNVHAVKKLLMIGKSENIPVDKHLLREVEKFYQIYRGHVINHENKSNRVPWQVKVEIEKHEEKNWEEFVIFYKEWLSNVNTDFNDDPFLQYKEKSKVVMHKV